MRACIVFILVVVVITATLAAPHHHNGNSFKQIEFVLYYPSMVLITFLGIM